MYSLVDQDNLLTKMKKWSGGDDDQFFVRPYTSSDTQFADGNTDKDDEVAQRRTPRTAGRASSRLAETSAIYKTTRFAVPLFFLCVRTNVDYVEL